MNQTWSLVLHIQTKRAYWALDLKTNRWKKGEELNFQCRIGDVERGYNIYSKDFKNVKVCKLLKSPLEWKKWIFVFRKKTDREGKTLNKEIFFFPG